MLGAPCQMSTSSSIVFCRSSGSNAAKRAVSEISFATPP